jgi:hypothetical protein
LIIGLTSNAIASTTLGRVEIDGQMPVACLVATRTALEYQIIESPHFDPMMTETSPAQPRPRRPDRDGICESRVI